MGAAQEDHRRVVGDGALAADDEHGPRRGQRPELGDEYVLAPPAVPREGLLTHHEGHGVRPVAEGPHLDAGKVVLQMPGGSHVGAVLRAADAELRARSVAVAEVAADAHRHLAAQFAGEDDRLDHGLHVVVRGHSRPVPLVVHDDDARLARPHAEEPCLPVQGPRVPPPLPQPDERRAEHAGEQPDRHVQRDPRHRRPLRRSTFRRRCPTSSVRRHSPGSSGCLPQRCRSECSRSLKRCGRPTTARATDEGAGDPRRGLRSTAVEFVPPAGIVGNSGAVGREFMERELPQH